MAQSTGFLYRSSLPRVRKRLGVWAIREGPLGSGPGERQRQT